MLFDFRSGLKKRETLLHKQSEVLDDFVETFKTPFREWYEEIDKDKVNWLISQFLFDCGYTCKQEDFILRFNIPTGVGCEGLNKVTVYVKQYSARFVIGELFKEVSLRELKGETNEN